MMHVELHTELVMADMELKLELEAGQCKLTIEDTVSGEMVKLDCTPEQAGAIWFLAIAGESDKLGDKLVKRLYKLAEPAVEGLARNLRPIP